MQKFVTVLATCVLILAGASAVSAQPGLVINPNTLQFTPSTDHNLIGLDGQPVVTRYDARAYLEGASQPLQSWDLGKPTPDPDGTIRIANHPWIVAAAMNVRLLMRVATIGPGGEGLSDPSNPFGNVGPPAKGGTPVMSKQ